MPRPPLRQTAKGCAMPVGDGEGDSDQPAPGYQTPEEPVYVISIAARLAGLPSWTLRVLDKEGIVRPQRTAGDRRLYSDRDITLLARVRYLTEDRGVNMNGVKLILEMEGRRPVPDQEPPA
jgi:MerR family transcriptional regulator/heat shock protein HspR